MKKTEKKLANKDYLERDMDEAIGITFNAWVKNLTAQKALSALGVLTTSAYSCRINQKNLTIKIGMFLKDEDNNQYKVVGVTETGPLKSILMESVL